MGQSVFLQPYLSCFRGIFTLIALSIKPLYTQYGIPNPNKIKGAFPLLKTACKVAYVIRRATLVDAFQRRLSYLL